MEDGIYITQYKYIKEILKKFGMQNSKPVGTPMSKTRHKLSKDNDSKVYGNSSVEIASYNNLLRKVL